MRRLVLIGAVLGSILISVSAVGHHKLGHQSPNTPYWGIPEEVECLHIEEQIEKIARLIKMLPAKSSLRPEAEERLDLLLSAFASRCRVI